MLFVVLVFFYLGMRLVNIHPQTFSFQKFPEGDIRTYVYRMKRLTSGLSPSTACASAHV